jgi:hypothetical protein
MFVVLLAIYVKYDASSLLVPLSMTPPHVHFEVLIDLASLFFAIFHLYIVLAPSTSPFP